MTDEPRPAAAFRFEVHIAEIGPRGGAGRVRELDVQQVILPDFVGRAAAGDPAHEASTNAPRLVLRRGHTGTSYFYDWWDQERNPKFAGSRSVSVTLLDDELRPVTIWRFRGCRLGALTYSPLDALQSTVLMESAAIDYESVVQSSPRSTPRPTSRRRTVR